MNFPWLPNNITWLSFGTSTYAQKVVASKYKCGYCSSIVSSEKGWISGRSAGTIEDSICISICPHCEGPSISFGIDFQVPGVAFGNSVGSTPQEINTLYEEARICTSAGAYTSAVMACRKLLMHIAVEQGAKEGNNFIDYVNYLATKGFVPPNGLHWVDHIRKKGNEANHEIKLMDKADAENLITFSEMLLKFIYEFPSKVPKPEAPKGP